MEKVYGVEVEPLPEGEIAHEVIVLTKVLTREGEQAVSMRHSGLPPWERIGMLTGALDRARRESAESWRADDDDDD